MRTRRPVAAILLSAMLLSGGCVMFHGRAYPATRHTWSEVACMSGDSESDNLLVTFADRFDTPLPGATISVVDGRYKREVVTGAEGTRELTVPSGKYRIIGALWGFHSAEVEVEISSAHKCTVKLFTEADASLAGPIITASGRPTQPLHRTRPASSAW